MDRAPDPPPEQEPADAHPPYDIEIEQAMLGAIILDQNRAAQAMGVLSAEHFYDPLHARIFEQIVAWVEEGDRAISPLTLHAAMKSDPGLVEVGGTRYLAGLCAACPAMPPVRSYALTIRELFQRREALEAMDGAIKALTESPMRVRDAMRVVIEVADRAERVATSEKFQSTADAAREAIREAERASSGQPVRAVMTGIASLDREIGGLRGGDFCVVAGKSGMGKSALMGGISWRAATRFFPVIVFSLEMKRLQWVQRLLTDIDFDDPDIRTPLYYRKFRASGMAADGRTPMGFTGEEFSRLVMAERALEDLPWLEIHDEDGLTMAQIGARTRAFQAKWEADPRIREGQGCAPGEKAIGLVLIDYLQIVDPASRGNVPREREVASIARGGKALTKNTDWPVVAGSQLNEDDKGRGKEEQRPRAADVRESKVIFHEADLLFAPYRPAWYVQNRKPDGGPGDPAWTAWKADLGQVRNKFELLGLKNRMGRPFDLDLFCEIGANAVRDEAPMRRHLQQEADDLLSGLKG